MCQSSAGHHYLCNYLLFSTGQPNLGITINPFISAIIGFSLSVGAYASEIIRVCYSINTKRTMGSRLFNWYDIYPSIKANCFTASGSVSIPPLSNTFISLLKDTSLASLILVAEMFRKAQEIAAKNYEFLLLYIEANALYWILCTILSFIQGNIEDRLNRYVAK